MEIKGIYNQAKIFTNNIDPEAHAQIKYLCDNKLLKDSKIRIMPDVHYGNGCVVGFTATMTEQINPYWIGVDIGCGLYSLNIGKKKISFDKLDKFIKKNIITGNESHDEIYKEIDEAFVTKVTDLSKYIGIDTNTQLKQLGSLGSGNHFIEIGKDTSGDSWLVVHTGSRGFGYNVANYYQKMADQQSANRDKKEKTAYLENSSKMEYLQSIELAQEFASINRKIIGQRILDFLKIEDAKECFETIHNYIDVNDGMIRKGAIAARENEKVMIPLNMRDGIIMARGKGNADWNFSAPHGAGRKVSRTKAKSNISIDIFRKSMRNIWSSTISEKTLDEAPQAYKSKNEIIDNISDTVDILDIIVPSYNFKGF